MAVVAIVAALDMVGILAGGRNSIVAGTTCSSDLQMVDGDGRGPLCAVVAVLANVSRGYVRRVLAGGCRAVVA